jgi:hypothetical protein
VEGDMAFQEISEVVPWLELAYDQGQDLSAPQFGHDEGKPRVFKTHAWAPHCPKGAKYVTPPQCVKSDSVLLCSVVSKLIAPTERHISQLRKALGHRTTTLASVSSL